MIRNVRYMADPEYAAMHGGIRTPFLRDEDIARLSDALASRLAERGRGTPDSDASLALIAVMNGRRDLCAKSFAVVPNGLRDQRKLSSPAYTQRSRVASLPMPPTPFSALFHRRTSRGWLLNPPPSPMNGPHGRHPPQRRAVCPDCRRR